MAHCRKRSTPVAIGYKPHVIQPELGEQPFDAKTHQTAIGSILYAAVAEIPDQEIAHCSFLRKLRKWRFRFEERREGVAAAR